MSCLLYVYVHLKNKFKIFNFNKFHLCIILDEVHVITEELPRHSRNTDYDFTKTFQF